MAEKRTKVLADPELRLPELLAELIGFIKQDDPNVTGIIKASPTEQWDTSQMPHRQWYDVEYGTSD